MLPFSELSKRNKGPIWRFHYCFYVIAFKRCFQSVILEPQWQVKLFYAFQHIQKNNVEWYIFMAIEYEPRDKSSVTNISQMRRTIFQQLKVLINHRINYIVSLWHICKLSICWIGTPINIRSVIKWWLRFDVIDGSWFFGMKFLSHLSHYQKFL